MAEMDARGAMSRRHDVDGAHGDSASAEEIEFCIRASRDVASYIRSLRPSGGE